MKLLEELIADIGELFAVRRPGRDIDCSLAAEQFHQLADLRLLRLAARHWHHAQRHVLIRRMIGNAFFEGDEHEPFSIRRGMWKPVLVVVARDPFGFRVVLAGAVYRYAPDIP